MSGRIDPPIQKLTSVHVESMFPDHYRELGPNFVAFTRAFFEWLDSPGSSGYVSRRMADSRDVDACADEFLTHFQREYLQKVRLDAAASPRVLVKHCLDVYRSRGTPRCDDLLFRLLFGVGAEVYYPGDDLLRPSDGRWVVPRYLEVTSSAPDLESNFEGVEVEGVATGAVAFCERVTRTVTASGKSVAVLHVSAVAGNFRTGELLNRKTAPLDTRACPRVTGSLTTLTVTAGASGFANGDRVTLSGPTGVRGQARVSATEDGTGQVEFDLEEGGYGYAANSPVLASDVVLGLTAHYGGTAVGDHWQYFGEVLTQSKARVNYISSTGAWARGDNVRTYHANNLLKGRGVVLADAPSNSTAGTLTISVRSGTLDSSPRLYADANAHLANVSVANGYNDYSANGTVIGQKLGQVSLVLSTPIGVIRTGEVLTLGSNADVFATVSRIEVQSASMASLILDDSAGRWLPGDTVTGSLSGATAVITSASYQVGLRSLGGSGSFTADALAPARGSQADTVATVATVSTGSGANAAIRSLAFTESVTLVNDHLLTYAATALNAATYGLPHAPTANGSSPMLPSVNAYSLVVGEVSALGSIQPGADYDVGPVVRIFEDRIWPKMRLGWQVDVTGATGQFSAGDVVTQTATSARGRVYSANSSVLTMRRMSVDHDFEAGHPIAVEATGSAADVALVQLWRRRPSDEGAPFEGLDARVTGTAVAAMGSAVTLEVIDSGLGYSDAEALTFSGPSGSTTGAATAHLGTQGVGLGRWTEQGGVLSGVKRLHDGDYWQDFSYDLRSSVPLAKYRDVLKALLHVEGTRAHGSFWHRGRTGAPPDPQGATVAVTYAEVAYPLGVHATSHVGGFTPTRSKTLTGVTSTGSAGVVGHS